MSSQDELTSSSDAEEGLGVAVDEDLNFSDNNVYKTDSGTSGHSVAHDGTVEELPSSQRPKSITARAYQLELFQASMQQNIIVAMDTGSGKTQVAVLRIQAELERTAPNKRVWFLAPTVALCAQQHKVIHSQLPVANSIVLTGADNIDSWSNINIWDAVLANVRVVVCTYAVLRDALKHAFVTMDSISLLVIDEAHNCTGRAPGRSIMTEFYLPLKAAGGNVPHVLGLTASPVTRSDLSSMEDLESSLDAMCRGPTLQREDLLANVHRPLMTAVTYKNHNSSSAVQYTRNMKSLRHAVEQLDIAEDPYVLDLMSQGTARSLRKLETVLQKHDTYTQNQMRGFERRSLTLFRELGSWAADNYIYEVIAKITYMSEEKRLMGSWADDEHKHFHRILKGIDVRSVATPSPTPDVISSKLHALLRILHECEGSPVGIIFVEERATSLVLSQLLATIPELSARYKFGCMVGTSSYSARKRDIHEVLHKGDDMMALDKFRLGEINILVATSVLEEGIDVPACNLVICFDKPANLKSFIQRRGRARMRASKLYLVLDESQAEARDWVELEAAMKRRYEDDMRELGHLAQIEEQEEMAIPPLHSKTTAAKLTVDDAKSHLDHFCRVVTGSQRYVDASPEYLVTETITSSVDGTTDTFLGATVLLPVSLPPNLRTVHSSRKWRSERNAKKDAAFQAYKMLYEAGLVNENLLPVGSADVFDRSVEGRSGLAKVREQWNPWPLIAEAWESGSSEPEIHRRRLKLTDHDGLLMCELDALLPVAFPPMASLNIYWAQHSEHPWTVNFDADPAISGAGGTGGAACEAQVAQEQTQVLLGMAFGHRFSVSEQSSALRFVWPQSTLTPQMVGGLPFSRESCEAHGGDYLVRSPSGDPYVYQSVLPIKPAAEFIQQCWKPGPGEEEPAEDASWVSVRKLPKNCGFVKKVSGQHSLGSQHQEQHESKEKTPRYIIPEQVCTMDIIPATLVQFGMLVPSITRAMEPYFVAQELLRRTPLGSLGFKSIDLVVNAITASSAGELENYERIEFLGDAVLKLGAVATCAANNLLFPESYLSLLKDRLVSNSRLCKAALAMGLDQFIMTRNFTLSQWRKMMITPAPPNDTRNMSTKTLADVIEALIGVAHIEGGMTKALDCISVLIPGERWRGLDESRMILYKAAPSNVSLPSTLEPLEQMLGYTFRKKSLLVEAMTHASFSTLGTAGSCLERLEFLGDSVLEIVVVSRMFAAKNPIQHFDMHLLRTAVVNGDFLGFLAMEWRAAATTRSVVVEAGEIQEVETRGLPLFSFLRHSASGNWVHDQQLTVRRHSEMAPGIKEALEHGRRYPWELLARLSVSKVHSDVLEAVIGAVWVDSGSLEECEKLLERAGILGYLDRAHRDGVKILHPREELGRLAQSEKVVYKVTNDRTAAADENENGGTVREGNRSGFSCSLTVGDRCVASIGGAVNRNEAMTKAALEAVQLWEKAGGSWGEVEA